MRRALSLLFVAVAFCGCAPAAPVAPSAEAAPSPDPVIARFQQRAHDDPRDAGSRAILAELLVRRFTLKADAAALPQAEAAARDALRLDPAQSRAATALVRALAALNRTDEALAAADAFGATSGANVFVLEAAADAALDGSRPEEIDRRVDVLGARSDDGPAALARARLLMARGKPVQAADLAAEAARRARTGGQMPHEIAACLVAEGTAAFESGDLARARLACGKAIREDETFAAAWSGLARIDLADGRDAEANARRAAELRPGPEEQMALAVVLERAGKTQEAKDVRDAAFAAASGSPVVFRRELSLLTLARGDAETAQRLADEEVASQPNASSHAALATIALARGRLDDAATAAEAIVRLGSRDPGALVVCARVFAAHGDTDRARSMARTLASMSSRIVPSDLLPLTQDAPR